MRYLRETRDRLLEKRRRRAEREGEGSLQAGTGFQKNTEGLMASPQIRVNTGIEVQGDRMVERTAAAGE